MVSREILFLRSAGLSFYALYFPMSSYCHMKISAGPHQAIITFFGQLYEACIKFLFLNCMTISTTDPW